MELGPRAGEDDHQGSTPMEVCPDMKNQNLGFLEELPVEIAEIILSRLRPKDLVSVAAISPKLEVVVRNRRLWRETTVYLRGEDVTSQLRQLHLAPQIAELQIGLGALGNGAIRAIRRYNGPIPRIQSLRLRLSEIGHELAIGLLERFGRSAKYLELDLRHGLLEQPHCHAELLQRLRNFNSLERMTVRVDTVNDVVLLTRLKRIKLVEIDIHRLRVGDVHDGGRGPEAGAAVAHLISQHSEHIHTLCLPPTFDPHISSSVLCCENLKTLASNVWTLPAVQSLSHLECLHVFPPDSFMTSQDVVTIIHYAHRSHEVLSKVRELRLLNCDVYGYLPPHVAPDDIIHAILNLLLSVCRNMEVLMVQWEFTDDVQGDFSWIDSLLSTNPEHLRELYLGSNFACPRHILALARYCPTLEILDVRRSSRVIKPGRRQTKGATTHGTAGMRRALDLLQGVLPKLSILFDDNADNYYDWNFYLSPGQEEVPRANSNYHLRTSSLEEEYPMPANLLDKMFVHLMTLDQWVSAGAFSTPRRDEVQFWRCATLDSFLWSTESFCQVLRKAPALGLVDCRNRRSLSPGKRGLFWMKSLVAGPKETRAIRMQTSLVSPKLWQLMEKSLRKFGGHLERLELDFRGRPMRDWRDVLCTLSANPNLTDLAIRGTFDDDDRPVLDWLHGRLPSLRRLDLRDCQMATDAQTPAFIESFKILLKELRGTLMHLALPPLPKKGATEVMRLVSQLTELREIGMHVNEMSSLQSFKSILSLEVYGDRKSGRYPCFAPILARSLRAVRDSLRGLHSLILPADLFKSQLVKEAVYDTMPNLRILHVIDVDRKLKMCVEGPRCRDLSIWQ